MQFWFTKYYFLFLEIINTDICFKCVTCSEEKKGTDIPHQQEWHHCMWPQIRVFVLRLYVQCSMVRRLNQSVGPMAPSQTNILPKSRTEDVPWPKTSSCRPVRADSHRCERQTTHFYTNAAHKREQKTMLTGGESRNIKVRIRGGGGFFTMKTLCSLQTLLLVPCLCCCWGGIRSNMRRLFIASDI